MPCLLHTTVNLSIFPKSNLTEWSKNQIVCTLFGFMVIKSVRELGSQRQGLPWRRPGSIHCDDKVPTIKENLTFENVYESYMSDDSYLVWCVFLPCCPQKNAKMIWFQSFFKELQFSRQAVKFHESSFGKAHWQCWRYPGFLTNTVMSRCPNMSFRVASLCLIHTMAKGSFKVFNDFW